MGDIDAKILYTIDINNIASINLIMYGPLKALFPDFSIIYYVINQ